MENGAFAPKEQMLHFPIYFQISDISKVSKGVISRGARDSKNGKKWPESSRILDYIISEYGVSEV